MNTSNTEPYSLESLKERVRAGWAPKFLFFWGHTGSPGKGVGKECLSQWYPAPFTLEGDRYATAEHYMMAEKARLFGDLEVAARILKAEHPSDAKKLGRGVRGFEERRWKEHRFEIVVRGSVGKFGQNPELGTFLEGTGSRVLVEASPRDAIWGIGLSEKDPRAQSPLEWPGLNLLGFALMVARAQLSP